MSYESEDVDSDDFASVFAAGWSLFAAPSDDEPVSESFPAGFREPRP
jgi:hypothetical protein